MPEDKVRLIKKYPNRRLYDTRTSSYVTLAEVKELVLKHEDFQVVDAKTGEDITRNILLQIILEEEGSGAPLFSSDLLAQMIRFYGDAMQGMLGQYLENNIRAFAEMQKKLEEQAKALGQQPFFPKDMWSQFLHFQGPALQQMMAAYVEQSQKMFREMQEQIQAQTQKMFAAFTPSANDKARKGGESR